MNSEMYVFTVVVAVIGMVTVFTALTLLSLMMMALKRAFPTTSVASAVKPHPPVTASLRPVADDATWVAAAAAAYLALEEEEGRRSAEAWKPATADRLDPWMNQSRR